MEKPAIFTCLTTVQIESKRQETEHKCVQSEQLFCTCERRWPSVRRWYTVDVVRGVSSVGGYLKIAALEFSVWTFFWAAPRCAVKFRGYTQTRLAQQKQGARNEGLDDGIVGSAPPWAVGGGVGGQCCCERLGWDVTCCMSLCGTAAQKAVVTAFPRHVPRRIISPGNVSSCSYASRPSSPGTNGGEGGGQGGITLGRNQRAWRCWRERNASLRAKATFKQWATHQMWAEFR